MARVREGERSEQVKAEGVSIAVGGKIYIIHGTRNRAFVHAKTKVPSRRPKMSQEVLDLSTSP